MDQNILNLIRQYFPQIAEPQLQREIAATGKLYSFRGGEVIMDYGSYVRIVPMVIEGSIKVTRESEEGNEIFLYYLNPGETCAMSFTCCMMNKKSDIRTTAEEDVTLIGIPIKHVDEWMSKYQSWKNFVMRAYDDRMKELMQTIDNIAFKKMDERLLKYLYDKSQTIQSKIIQTTHQEIAFDLNASREAVSRLLKQLEKQHRVRLGRNQIELL